MIVEVSTPNGVDIFKDANAEIAGTAFVVAQKGKTTIYADKQWWTAWIKEEEPEVKLD